jgi:hypothetical protein
MIAPTIALSTGQFVLSSFAQAIQKLYGVAADINTFVDDHIHQLKASNNVTISRTGAVLEGAKYGFGLGYMSSVAIIAGGQLLLGNSLLAIAEIATAATLSNPVAMTCAAVGAIYFGWNALSEDEKNSILEKLKEGLNIGVELIKAIFNYVINWFKDIHDLKIFQELKENIRDAAAVFHRKLSDVTKESGDRAGEILTIWKARTFKFGDATLEKIKGFTDMTKEATESTLATAKETFSKRVEVIAPNSKQKTINQNGLSVHQTIDEKK